MTEDEEELFIAMVMRPVILSACLPPCEERIVHGVRAWLPPDLNPWSHAEELRDAMGIVETETRTLGECIEDVVVCMDQIEDGESPVGVVPDFEIPCVAAELQDRGSFVALRCTGLRAFGRIADADLAVMAMSAEEGWALTLHGLWLFDRQPDEPEALDPDAEPRGP